jgi:hypothetical protein
LFDHSLNLFALRMMDVDSYEAELLEQRRQQHLKLHKKLSGSIHVPIISQENMSECPSECKDCSVITAVPGPKLLVPPPSANMLRIQTLELTGKVQRLNMQWPHMQL